MKDMIKKYIDERGSSCEGIREILETTAWLAENALANYNTFACRAWISRYEDPGDLEEAGRHLASVCRGLKHRI